ncbi:Hypothetical protein SMAX5B_012039 [Scophthalmus maximus]|nr:protein S100-A1 [Scophthalmus maximus]AWO96567.1 Hypothetical protein SMAX5B_012039 [Scophthalmus maximus]
MPRLEDAIKNMVEVFVENAKEDGTLNKDELKNMMEKEFDCAEIKGSLPSMDFDKAMGRMDKNHDGEVNFREFATCVAFIANCCYNKKTGKGKGCGRKGEGCH